MEGKKYDNNKPMWDLLPLKTVGKIVDVLTFGANKYAPGNWKVVPNAKDRYFAALMRHLEAWQAGETVDKESNLSHLAHAGCCLLFLLWFEDDSSRND